MGPRCLLRGGRARHVWVHVASGCRVMVAAARSTTRLVRFSVCPVVIRATIVRVAVRGRVPAALMMQRGPSGIFAHFTSRIGAFWRLVGRTISVTLASSATCAIMCVPSRPTSPRHVTHLRGCSLYLMNILLESVGNLG